MLSLRKSLLLVGALTVTSASYAQGVDFDQVVNVDVGPVPEAYVGQGALADPGNNFWTRITSNGVNLTASDGVTQTGISVTLSGSNVFSYENENANGLLNDYFFATTFDLPNYIGTLTIEGLEPGTRYLVYVYSAGRGEGESALIELNDQRAATSGIPSEEFIEGGNYVVMEVIADANGSISGTYRPFDSFNSAAINGLQIKALAPGSRPAFVTSVVGAESPTVHSPGDTFEFDLLFNRPVTLSQAGGLRLMLDMEGQLVEAVHTGATSGQSLRFTAVAPVVTTFSTMVDTGSLELLGGATLTGADGFDASLAIADASLPNDQVSAEGLSLYPSVASLEPLASPHYSFRVREINGQPAPDWQDSFAFVTKSIDFAPDTTQIGYYNAFVGGWSHTFTNFEMANNVPVEVEITRLDPDTGAQLDIETAVPHPRRNVRSWRVENGRAYVTIDEPVLFSVDIDGQFDDNPSPTSGFVNEDALHAVSVFANRFILDKPDPTDPDVLVVAPGEVPPENGSWTTLYFEPGEHQIYDGDWEIGDDFRLHSNRSYYIPGNALVHGNFNNRDDDNDGRNIRIFGHGVISGERIPHIQEQGLVGGEDNPDAKWNRGIRIANKARGSSVEGITLVDPANHGIALQGGFSPDPANHNSVRWTKIITWRANGDGVSPNGSGVVEDSFMRTQDDGSYVGGLGIRRVSFWADVNGMPLRLSNMLNDNIAAYRYFGPLEVEDIDILYSRTRFGSGPGRSMIGFPDPAAPFPLNDGSHVIFKNIRVEDKFPTRTLFGWDLASGSGGTTPVAGVQFSNVRAAARNVDGELDPFFGVPAATISGLVFDDVILAGEHYDALDDFVTNGFVSGFVFENTDPAITTYVGGSGLGKWYIDADWDNGVEPANNDIVNHTSFGGDLRVDAQVYAGDLTVAHVDLATVTIASGGHLSVTGTATIGGAGAGELSLESGTLELLNEQNSALALPGGVLNIAKGTLLWSGNHVGDLQSLFDNGAITLDEGQLTPPIGSLIGAIGADALYAEFDALAGVTRARVFSEDDIDSDGDGISDSLDNCTLVANADQRDTNGDGFGNACDADLNNDCVVNVVDLGLLRTEFFTSADDADLNGDGVVNVVDLGLMRAAFFAAPGPAATECTIQSPATGQAGQP